MEHTTTIETVKQLRAGVENLAEALEAELLSLELMRTHLTLAARDARAVVDEMSGQFVSMPNVLRLMERTKNRSLKYHAAFQQFKDRYERYKAHAELPTG